MATLEMHPELGREVPVGSIDKELRKLWEEDEARTNASLMNLAVYSEAPGSLEKNSAAVRELTAEHACRALLIGIDRNAADASIRAWITAHCHLSSGRKSVCCEQIAFALTGKATGRLRNTVFAHLASDLPLIFWWQGELTPIFEDRLYSLVDRFVFDSSEWSDPIASFGTISDAVGSATRELVVQDLAWTRSFQFRVSIAALYDDPLVLAGLPKVDTVEIIHHPDNRGTALQMLAWLAVQAGWRDGMELDLAVARRSGNKEGFSFEGPGGVTISATLTADESSAPLGLVSLKGGDTEVSVSREAGAAFLIRRIKCASHVVELPGPVDPDSSAGLIGEQLARGGKNSLFQKILPRFRQLLER
ncbi:glucose-6-phosphate dehydrogenase assembly protein OpcA [Luteolibacter sp. GHJ8]|uniref:Glucose-6-phosphate dehydrogenase assembly protein OpcA n=1 Tax=Luteolibacter rhizosphaerae TaxID=2989719 RepID=A0ABT3G324_9BACT|nr:glucose-6-phosphate dehydrogenase assembly protein OpcA [Luteolibacter rhizosphaerae]MCW1914243.1 glucose-6-phosphate dehydrogenase assembly protein OpcA [Luteolibacter rhizosphaerae]